MREPTGRVYAGSAVSLILHLYLTLTAKMEDSIAKLKHFSKLDFQSKREVINNGRPKPELKASNDGTEDNSIDFSHLKPNCFENVSNLENKFGFGRTAAARLIV